MRSRRGWRGGRVGSGWFDGFDDREVVGLNWVWRQIGRGRCLLAMDLVAETYQAQQDLS